MAAGTERRLRWKLWGTLALGVAAFATACGKTGNRPPSNDVGGDAGSPPGGDAGGAGAGVGGSGGGGAVAGAEASGGGGADAGASGSGGEGGVPEQTRPITVRVVDSMPEPLPGLPVLVNGVVYTTDDEGYVHAQAPLGEYDIAVDDNDGSDSATGVNVFQGITIDEPMLRIERSYGDQFPPRSSASGKLIGAPNGAVANVSFVSSSGWLENALVSHPAGSDYSLQAEWYGRSVTAVGDVFALLWTQGADQQPDAFWFGSAPVTWGPMVSLLQDITVSATSTHGVTFKMISPADGAISKGLWLGSVTLHADPPLETKLLLPRALATSSRLQNPQFGFTIKPPSADWTGPYIRGTVAVADDASELVIDVPSYLETLAPPNNAKNIDPTATTFKVSEIPNTCKVFEFLAGAYSARIYTAKDEVAPPDLSALGQHWNKGWPSSFWATAKGPCASIDELVAPTSDPAAQTTDFVSARSYFRTRK